MAEVKLWFGETTQHQCGLALGEPPSGSRHLPRLVVFLFLSFCVYIRGWVLTTLIMGDHLTMYISQSMMLHTLTLYGAVCEFELNKTGGKAPNLCVLSVTCLGLVELS